MPDLPLSNTIFFWVYLFWRMLLLCFLCVFEIIYCCLTFRNSNRCDFISFSGAWRTTWLLGTSVFHSPVQKKKTSAVKQSFWWKTGLWLQQIPVVIIVISQKRHDDPSLQLSQITESVSVRYCFFFSSSSKPKGSRLSGQFSSYPRKFPTD